MFPINFPATQTVAVDSALWRACAGTNVNVPEVGTMVYYFPEGHAEQCDSPPALAPPVWPIFPCRVLNVRYLADRVTDEVFAAVFLQPDFRGAMPSTGVPSTGRMSTGLEREGSRTDSYSKVLTRTDTTDGRALVVPVRCAQAIFPPLNYERSRQNLTITDVMGVDWVFEHVCRTARTRHLLTSSKGWMKLVKIKELKAGDTVVFIRDNSTGRLYIAIQRQSPHMMGLSARFVEEALQHAEKGKSFEVIVYPRNGLPEYVVNLDAVDRALSLRWAVGMPVKMPVASDDSSRSTWLRGQVSYSLESGQWRGSPCKMLQVMSSFHVGGKVVESVDLLRKRHWAWRLDVWPFAVVYALWMIAVVPTLDFLDATIVFGGLAAAHILVLLFTAWSVDFKCFIQFSKVNDIYQADACKIIPVKFCGSREVVPLHFCRVPSGTSSSGDVEEIYFDFRKQRFIYSVEKNTFCKLRYPSKETIGYYLKHTGHVTEAKVNAAVEKWGRNLFEYPQPTFQKLMKENCTEPFFVFQVFCVGLWCLDEYWYYSLFTLFMLFMLESTMAKSRLKTLTELRRVRVDNQTLMVYRCGKWVKLPGTDLLPGDIVSITRASSQNEEEKNVPADMLILAGSAIVNEAILTGESTPQWKVSISGRAAEEKLSARRDKSHILFGGTKILQHTPDKSFQLKTLDSGCLAVVLRTGFETSQGKLMRTILFSTERVTANSWESGLFILFLVVFSIIAAGYVLKKGLEDPTRSKYKLFLSCSLPMELSIAVNTSLIALACRGIFCTEPFRIPFAGKVDICCFDKTGTLTSDDMEFCGIVGLGDGAELESDMKKVPDRTLEILASCHALVYVDNKLVGDPLEKAALKGIEWSYKSDEKAFPKKGGGQAVQIVQRYHFASHLKRMSVVVRTQEQFFAFVKGAPETIQDRLVDLPPSYVEAYKKYTRQGSRVLAIAYKPLPEMTVSEVRSLDREIVESSLTFGGFAVFNCPIREDSAAVLSELKQSSHDLVMITGDQALTACHVASQVHIISKPTLILGPMSEGTGYEWVSPDEMEHAVYSDVEVPELAESHDLCIGGDSIEMLLRTSSVQLVVPYVKVFARVAPEQKELIMTTLKMVGRMTLMCGDGTNDVGALKQAHVGVALLNAVPPPKTGKSSPESAKEEKTKSSKAKKLSLASETGKSASENGAGSSKIRTVPKSDSMSHSSSNRHLTAAEMQRQKLKKLMDDLNEEGDGRAAPIVKLGDASLASPFTAKHASVAPTTDIIRQGRSTLVTTLQMFKILGLNCLATAYVLSVMHLDGVKLGDVQATISGIFTASFFLFISHARPLPTLSAARPHPNIFCWYVFLSLLGQFAMHLVFLISSVQEAQKHMPEECIEPDSKFHPNLVNTVSYMVNMMIQVATFAVNYMGHPFNQSIRENKPFMYALVAAAGFFGVITSNEFRDLNDWLRLVPLPPGLGSKLMVWAFLMFTTCYAWERLMRLVFPG